MIARKAKRESSGAIIFPFASSQTLHGTVFLLWSLRSAFFLYDSFTFFGQVDLALLSSFAGRFLEKLPKITNEKEIE